MLLTFIRDHFELFREYAIMVNSKNNKHILEDKILTYKIKY